MTDTTAKSCCHGWGDGPADERRGFIAKTAALALGAIALLTPAVVSIVALLNPLRQKSSAGRFIRLTSLEGLPEDGTPRRFPIIADRSDAWNYFPSEPIGAVFLRRVKDRVEAIQVVCPHAGCHVVYDPKKRVFFCPCHSATFHLDGKQFDEKSPSPRPLDTLEVDRGKLPEVWVKFENFRSGISDKIPQA